ncbi:MAG: site-2 protease family protein, partial [Clostridia bacterium]|nr:site-2 protease family protein [Clostridia bacterium]
FHEIAHGYVANRCGDPTAKMLGRLSLDPRKHLDPIGTICLVLFGFGWAKPVPVNPRNFRNYRRDDFLVSIAGVTVNFTLFLLALALAVGVNGLLWQPQLIYNIGVRELVSSRQTGFAILLTGRGPQYAELMLHPWLQYVQRFLMMLFSMNLSIAVFNLLPIPPLDGWHILDDLVFKGRLSMNPRIFEMTRFILLALMLTGIIGTILSAVTGVIENGVLNLFLLLTGRP